MWHGIVLVLAIEMALITPPVALNVFVIKGISPPDVTLGQIYLGAMPFVAVELLRIVIFIAFPGLALWLPGMMK